MNGHCYIGCTRWYFLRFPPEAPCIMPNPASLWEEYFEVTSGILRAGNLNCGKKIVCEEMWPFQGKLKPYVYFTWGSWENHRQNGGRRDVSCQDGHEGYCTSRNQPLCQWGALDPWLRNLVESVDLAVHAGTTTQNSAAQPVFSGVY